MATSTDPFAIYFPAWYDTRSEDETPAKGHLGGVQVQLGDGTTYSFTFYDPVRLQQAIEDETREGRAYFSEPGLVVVPEVTTETVRPALLGLWRDGFFQHLKPIS